MCKSNLEDDKLKDVTGGILVSDLDKKSLVEGDNVAINGRERQENTPETIKKGSNYRWSPTTF